MVLYKGLCSSRKAGDLAQYICSLNVNSINVFGEKMDKKQSYGLNQSVFPLCFKITVNKAFIGSW